MPVINDVRVAGRLTRDPIIRDVGNQKVANFDIAVEKKYLDAKNVWQKQVSYVPCAVWGLVADRAREFLKKGSPVYLEGRLRSQSWQTKDGQKRSMKRSKCSRWPADKAGARDRKSVTNPTPNPQEMSYE